MSCRKLRATGDGLLKQVQRDGEGPCFVIT